MTTPVLPNAAAEEEFRYYIRWYENESADLGDRLWPEIQAAIDLIAEHPAIGEAVRRVTPVALFAGCRFAISRFSSCTASTRITSRSWRWHIRAESLCIGEDA